jgi:hypothetical protein
VFRYKFVGNMIDILKEYALIFTYFSCYSFIPVSSNVLVAILKTLCTSGEIIEEFRICGEKSLLCGSCIGNRIDMHFVDASIILFFINKYKNNFKTLLSC